MTTHAIRLSLATLLFAALALPALADDRVDRLEQQMQMMQRQLYRGGNGQPVDGADSGTGTASLLGRLNQMQEEMSQLRGQAEENKHQIEQLSRQMQLQQEDTQYRLEQLEKNGVAPNGAALGAAAPGTPGATAPGADAAAMPAPSPNNPPVQPPIPDKIAPPTAGPAETTGAAATTPADAKGLYNHAIGQMNKAQYAEAAASFTQFIQKFPKDPLVGNAYYWLGETHYVNAEYLKAADQFRQGFEAMPSGIKAPDNLLKLAMSLGKLNKKKEACTVLKQIKVKYAKGPEGVTSRAQREIDLQKCT